MELVFELEVSMFLDTLELHAFERAVIFVCIELVWALKNLVTDSKILDSSFLPAVTNSLRSLL